MKTTPLIAGLSEIEFKNRLKVFRYKATQLCGQSPDGTPLSVSVPAFFDKLIADTDNRTPEFAAQRAEFLQRAQTDPRTREQLCGIRVEQFGNYLMATTNIIPFFFNLVTLADDEEPVAKNTTTQEIQVSYVAEDGASHTKKIVKPQSVEKIALHWLTSDEVRYRKVDIYKGRIVDAALATIQLAYDVALQMDRKAFALLTAATGSGGAFGTINYTTGNKATRVRVPNSYVNVANLPTTNDITVRKTGSGTGESNLFRYDVFADIIKYSQQLSAGSPGEGPLIPTGRILIPGADPSDLTSEITPSGLTSNPVADQLLTMGYMTVDYLTKTPWVLVPDNTLSPGACYAEFNRKPGEVFLKPGLDEEKLDDSYATSRKNEEARYVRKPFGAYINATQRINAARFIYNENYSTSNP